MISIDDVANLNFDTNSRNVYDPIEAFKVGKYKSFREAWRKALNCQFWTHGITINQGNNWSVTKNECIRRLSYIRARLAREIFGNHWRDKARIIFLVFKHGTKQSSNEHFHALMAIRSTHDWSDDRIGLKIREIEQERDRSRWEKVADVEWNWQKDNSFHGYCTRYVHENSIDCDDWFVM